MPELTISLRLHTNNYWETYILVKVLSIGTDGLMVGILVGIDKTVGSPFGGGYSRVDTTQVEPPCCVATVLDSANATSWGSNLTAYGDWAILTYRSSRLSYYRRWTSW